MVRRSSRCDRAVAASSAVFTLRDCPRRDKWQAQWPSTSLRFRRSEAAQGARSDRSFRVVGYVAPGTQQIGKNPLCITSNGNLPRKLRNLLQSSPPHNVPIAPAASGTSLGRTTNRSGTASFAPRAPSPSAAVPRSAGSLPRSASRSACTATLPLVCTKLHRRGVAHVEWSAVLFTYGESAALEDSLPSEPGDRDRAKQQLRSLRRVSNTLPPAGPPRHCRLLARFRRRRRRFGLRSSSPPSSAFFKLFC